MIGRGPPVFELSLGGRSLSASALRHLVSAEITESTDELDSLSAQIVIPGAGGEVLELARPGAPFEVRLGYGDETVREIEGFIVDVAHTRSTSSPWSVSLRGVDELYRLKQSGTSRIWKGSHADIARAIARRYGLKPRVEEVDGETYELQEDADDATLLRQLAVANNYYVRIVNRTLYFRRRSTEDQTTVTLTWGRDIEDLNLTWSIEGIPTEVLVEVRDPTQDETIRGRATARDLRGISGGTSGIARVQQAFGRVRKVISNGKETTPSRAKARARAELQRAAERYAKGSVTCPGRPEAKSGGLLRLEGLGPLAGTYYIHQTRHALEGGGGYRTTIEFGSDSEPGGEAS